MKIGRIKRVEFMEYRYWTDKSGNAYWDLFHAMLGIASPTLMAVESERRYQAKLLGEKF